MASNTASKNDDRTSTRAIYGRALAALVAAQGNWAAVSEVQGAEKEAIEQWASKAKVNLADADAKARSKILEVANNALISVALGSTQPSALHKVVDIGLLATGQYDVDIQNPLKSEYASRFLTKRLITETVRRPDAYQHLSPPPDFQGDVPLVSIFVRVLNREEIQQKLAPAQWSLVIGCRSGRNMHVRDGYRIFGSELALSGSSPLDLFKAFCAVYGHELTIAGTKVGKVLMYQQFKGESAKFEAVGVENKHKIIMSTFFKKGSDGLEFAFGYAIDITKYAEAHADQSFT
jgi:hypothetical protein